MSADHAPLVLGIAGSPRRHGNSERLLEAALQGAEAAGARTRKLIAGATRVNPCRGCNACSATGECIQRDTGSELYAAIDEADAIIVASPVFFATVPAVLKTIYDRMQPYWARTYVLHQPRPARRPGAVLLVRGGGDPFGFDGALATTRSVLAVLGIDILGEVLVTGVDEPGDIEAHAEALADATELGAAVAREAAHRSSLS